MKVEIRYNLRSRRGHGGIYGYQYRKGSARRIVVNLNFHTREARRLHRGADWIVNEVVMTIDHEVAHAFSPWEFDAGSKARREEAYVVMFERAGAWARR